MFFTRIQSMLEFIVFAGGIALIYVGTQQSNSMITSIGVIVVGIAVLMRGVRVIRTRRDAQSQREQTGSIRTTTYGGCAAVVRGIVTLIVGVSIVVIGLFGLSLGRDAVANFVSESPGILAMILGAMGVLILIPEFIGSHRLLQRNIISRTITRFWIVVGIVICAAIFAYGWLLYTDPETADILRNSVLDALPPEIQQIWDAYGVQLNDTAPIE